MNIRSFALLAVMLVSRGAFAADAIVLKLEPYRNTVAVHANVGGRDGFFVFDTAGGLSLITPQFAEKIGCEPWGRVTGYAMMGNRIDAPRCNDVEVRIGAAQLKVPVAGVFDVMTLYPPDAQPLDGLIALNVFDGKGITIDFPAQTLTIETPLTLRRRIRGATEVPVRVQREAQGHALAVSIAVPTKKGRVWMELDSGNSRTILISKLYAPLFGLAPDSKEPQSLDYPLAGAIRIRSDRVFTPDMIIDGNLGMPFLKDVVLTIDFASGRVWIRIGK